jgi:hypothetical protein
MASGDTIETIEVVEPSLTINMNNAKDPGGVHESLDESEDKDTATHRTPQDVSRKLIGHAKYVTKRRRKFLLTEFEISGSSVHS